jgi:hypothetical protein
MKHIIGRKCQDMSKISHRSRDNQDLGERSCHHQLGTDLLLETCMSALFSPLPLVLEPPGGHVHQQDMAP